MVTGFVLTLYLDSVLGIGLVYFLYLIVTKQLFHFLEKKKLVRGDLIFIKYRGKLRKAYITDIDKNYNAVKLVYADKELNIDLIKDNWYPFSRISLPEHISITAKVLYGDSEDK